VFSSPLMQVPLAAQAAGPGRRVAILTARAVLTERHFAGVGWSAEAIRVVQLAPPAESHFVATFVGNAVEANRDRLEQDVADLAKRLRREHPDVGAVVMECANFPPFSAVVRRITGLPVFDLHTLGMLAHLTSTGARWC
jgi:hypothetical protein